MATRALSLIAALFVGLMASTNADLKENWDLYAVRKHRDKIWDEHKVSTGGTFLLNKGKVNSLHAAAAKLSDKERGRHGADRVPFKEFVLKKEFSTVEQNEAVHAYSALVNGNEHVPKMTTEPGWPARRAGVVRSSTPQGSLLGDKGWSTLRGAVATRAAWRAWGRTPGFSSQAVESTTHKMLETLGLVQPRDEDDPATGPAGMGITEGDEGGLERWMQWRQDLQDYGSMLTKNIA
eukprot:gene25606-31302_t